MSLPSLKGLGVQEDFNKSLDIGYAPYSSMVPKQLMNTVFEMESSSGKNRNNEKLDLGKYGWLTGHTTTGAASNVISNLKKNPKLDYKVKNIPGWNDLSTPESAFGHAASALAIAIRDNPGMSLEDIYFKKYVTAKGSDTPERRAQFRQLMGSSTPAQPKVNAPLPKTETPFAATNTGIAVNTALGLPKAVWDISKFISDKLTERVLSQYEKIKNEKFATTPEEFKSNLANVETLAMGFTGAESGAIKQLTPKIEKLLVNTTNRSTVIDILKNSLGHSDESANLLAGDLANAKTGQEVRQVFENTSKEAKVVQGEMTKPDLKGLGTETPLPETQIPQQVGESILQKSEGLPSPTTVPQTVENTSKPVGEEISGAIQRLNESLKTAKPARAELEKMYTAERSQRAAKLAELQAKGPDGTTGYFEQLKALQGELTSAENKAFKTNLIEEDINSLFKATKINPELDVWEKLNTQGALMKVLSGEIPQKGELLLLEKTFGKELVENVLKNRSTGEKILDGIGQLVNLPRAVMSSFDLSAPFRQGLALISHPKAFGSAFVNMFKQFGSEKAFQAMQESIAKMPEYKLMKQGKLSLTDVGATLTNREEKFMSSWAEKIWGFGKIVRGSNRAYTGFLNKLRADVFTDIVNGVKAGGRELDEKLVKDIASFVNTASGRGNIPDALSGAILNGIFFSPRLMASRITLLNPVKYVTADPVVRKEMMKSLFTVLGGGMTVLGLAKLNGFEVGTDPTSSDFGKIKKGDTRIDIWGGFQQYVRMAAQLATGKYTSTTGKVTTLGEGYKPLSRYDILMRQIESKEAPILSFVTSLLRQQDYTGKPIKITDEVAKRFIPMVVSDLYETAKDNPTMLPASLLSVFGFGVQTYEPPTYARSNKGMPGMKTSSLKQKSGMAGSLKGVGL